MKENKLLLNVLRLNINIILMFLPALKSPKYILLYVVKDNIIILMKLCSNI